MRRLLVGVAVLVCVGVAAPAWAQSSAVRDARRHMEDGQELFLQERWGEAAAEFLAAFELRPHTAFLYNAALAYHRLGEAQRAIELYRRYLDTAAGSRDRERVEENIRLLESSLASQPPPATTEPECVGEECPEEPGAEQETCAEDDVECQLQQEEQEAPPEPDIRIVLDPAAVAAGRQTEMKSVILVNVEPSDATVVLIDDTGTELARGRAPMEYTADAGHYALLFEHPEYRPVRTPIQVASGRYYVFHIEMSQPPAFLQVVSNVPGSTVYLDDRSVGPVGVSPWGNVVATGRHRIWVERPGYQPVVEDVEIDLGQEREVEVELERLSFGMLRVLTNVEEATVEVDGEEVGAAPLEHQLPPGEHELQVSARGMKDYSTTFAIERGRSTRVLVRLNPRPSRTSAWVSLTFSALTFAAAGVVGWYSTTIFDELENLAQRGRLASDDARIDRGFLFAVGADVGFGVGTIIAALSLYYFIRDPLPPSEGRVEDPVDFTENPSVPEAQPSTIEPLPSSSSSDRPSSSTPGPAAPAPSSAEPTVREPEPAAEEPEPAAEEPEPAAEEPEPAAEEPEPAAEEPEPAAEEPEPAAEEPEPAAEEPEPAAEELSPEESRWLYGPSRRARRQRNEAPRVRLGMGPGLVLHF